MTELAYVAVSKTVFCGFDSHSRYQTERGWISFGSFLKLPLLSMWLCHLDSVYKENESKVKLPPFCYMLPWRNW